jgi:protein phosphatase methylesterase 1
VPLPERRATFNVYAAGPPDASVCFLCLHGGGYTGATWSLVARALARPEEAGVGGSGGASEQQQRSYRVLAPDLRGHGLTATEDDADLSAETLREDVLALWRALAPATNPDQQQQPPPQSVVVVGHSMGGAIAVWACAAAANDVLPGLAGCVVVDVVEGTALAALPHMRAVLAARPRGFESPVDAARWALRSGACRNREAAEVSAPTQVVPASEAGEDADEQEDDDAEEEEDEADDDGPNCRPPPRFVWRTPLAASSRFWEGWYRGLSAAFLERLPAGLPRMLIAAGAERLDRALTVGQMQGKFQLLLVAGSGHAVQEDCPLVVSGALSQLARRFRIGEPPMRVPLPAAGGGRVLPVVAGPLLPAFGAAARRAPGGTAAAAAGVARVGGASFGAVEEEEEEEENEAC